MKNLRNWLAAWWLSCISLLLLSACGGGLDIEGTRFAARLTGEQEVPPSGSLATGVGVVTVNPENRLLTATVNTTGITGTVAHIHEGALGQSGPIVFPLTETAAGSGVWVTTVTISEEQLATLRAGNYYFNVHSAAFPEGEIRGQIVTDQAANGSTTTTAAGGTTTTTAAGGTTTTVPGGTTTTVPGGTTTTVPGGVTTTTVPGGVTTTTVPGGVTTTTVPGGVTTTTVPGGVTTTTVPGGVTTTTVPGGTTTAPEVTSTTTGITTTTTATTGETTTTMAGV